jgi:glucose/arabinose dehydrogenase
MRGRQLGFVFMLLALPAATAQPATKLSGYALSGETCGAFPKLPIGLRPGYCAGLVASKEDGLVFPRTIVQVPDTRFFVVADMGGWDPQRGRVLLLDPEAAQGKRVTVLLARLDLPHGLAVGIDRRVYVGTADKIFRFDPRAAQPAATVETILQGLPGLKPKLSDGTTLGRNAHPLKHFVFDRTGRLFVNIGAPSDRCATRATEKKPCAAGEGASPLAAVWMFTPPSGGIFPALRPGQANPPHDVFARGLRNSMALAAHPRFPDEGFALLQAENARDLPDADKPNEEINALERGKHYGWPYCYDLATVSPEYAAFLKTSAAYRNLCADAALYRRPHSLLPPHAAPLGMLYYEGGQFPELNGKLIVGLHGYRPTGSRVIYYDVDARGFPAVRPPPVHYNVSCAPSPERTFRTETESQVAAAPFTELIGDWHKVNGVRPQGAPVGMTVASDGAIWLVEDKNQTIIRIDSEPAERAAGPLPCDLRTPQQISELVGVVLGRSESKKRLTQLRTGLIERHCMGCHADFDLKPGMSEAQKDEAALRFLLAQDAWVYPGAPEAGRLHDRVWGKGAGKIMPANGAQLLAGDPAYRRTLTALDQFVSEMVPGARKRIDAGRGAASSISNRAGTSCGSIPNQTVVVVVDAKPKERPGFRRIYRPADRYLNGECGDRDGYYAPVANLRDL